MAETEAKMFDLIDALEALCEERIPIFPGRSIVDDKKLYGITKAFPSSISNEINDARIILKKKDEILQEARLRAERIIQDAENERYKLLNESNLNKALEEWAEKFRQTVFEECQQIRITAFNEAQEVKLNAKNEAIRMREASQDYAQHILNNLEHDLNKVYEDVQNSQQKLHEIRTSNAMQQGHDNNHVNK